MGAVPPVALKRAMHQAAEWAWLGLRSAGFLVAVGLLASLLLGP